MKARIGFVSNSSTSSFVCDVCGRQESGFDCSAYQFEMTNCVNGHTVCDEELLEDWKRNPDEDEYECPEECCPVCKFAVFGEYDLARFLEVKHGVSRDEVFAEVKKANKRRKKLYDTEYNTYVCTKFGIDRGVLLQEVKSTFATYHDFYKYTRGIK